MIVGKIRVENFRGMSLGLYDENNRLHATAVTERADLQAICDGYNAFLALSSGDGHTVMIDGVEPPDEVWTDELAEEVKATEVDQPRRGRGRPRKEQAATE